MEVQEYIDKLSIVPIIWDWLRESFSNFLFGLLLDVILCDYENILLYFFFFKENVVVPSHHKTMKQISRVLENSKQGLQPSEPVKVELKH